MREDNGERASSAPVRCSGCDSASFTAGVDGIPVCEYCHVPYTPPRRQCATCGAPYEPGAASCPSCGAKLVRQCPICGAVNPLEMSRCLVCHRTLDVTEEMFARLTRSTPDQLRRARKIGAEVKARQEAASDARLEKLWAKEERRQTRLARARAEQQRQERLVVTVALGVVAVVMVVAIALAVIIGSSRPLPLP